MVTAIVGINWGDEGKGRMVDLLSADYDIVSRYQGGNNAGHTVVNEKGKFILNLLPSGILRDTTVNVMGNGMVIDIEHLVGELARLEEKGVHITPANLRISDKAIICMPYHKQMDILEEDRLGDAKFGSTRRGIAPVYADKYMKKGIRMGDLLMDPAALEKKVAGIVEWKNLTVHDGYHADAIRTEDILAWLKTYGDPLKQYICDTTYYLSDAIAHDKSIMFEAQLGALRDIDFGIYPSTSSSSTIAAYAPIGAGIPFQKLDKVIGVIKAYSSCVGEGPFTAEFFGEEADALRGAGADEGGDAHLSDPGLQLQRLFQIVLLAQRKPLRRLPRPLADLGEILQIIRNERHNCPPVFSFSVPCSRGNVKSLGGAFGKGYGKLQQICRCGTAFSFASPKENAGKRKRA